jgi:hypothetical protein
VELEGVGLRVEGGQALLLRLLFGDQPLHELGALLLVSLDTLCQQQFADLRNATCFGVGDSLDFKSQFGADPESQKIFLRHGRNYICDKNRRATQN